MTKLILGLLLLLAPKQFPDAWVGVAYKDYKANEHKADAKYKDKWFFVHGVVQYRSSNYWTIYAYVLDTEGLPLRIADDQMLLVPQYNQGDKVDLVCMCAGEIVGMPLFFQCRVP